MKFNSSSDLAKFLGVTGNTVSRWVEAGLPYKAPNLRRYEFELEDVFRWLVSYSPRHKRFVESFIKRGRETN